VPEFIIVPNNPPPPGAEVFEFAGADGGRLRGAIFPAPSARATVVLMAGRVEFIEKYFEVVGDLNQRGFAVAMMDWRGQGLSERPLPDRLKGHIADFAVYRSDLQRFVEEIAARKLAEPFILMTHSMGGAPGLQLLADGYDKFRAAVLCAPMTQFRASPAHRAVAGLMSRIACALGGADRNVVGIEEHSLKFEGNVLTSDRRRHERFRLLQESAPEAIIREPTYGWLKAAVDAIDDLHRPDRFRNLKTPVLIISAENDRLVDSGDHERLAARSPLIRRAVIAGALHEIMMESDALRAAYWREFDAFIEPLLADR
jgi:lysophospholipase